LKSFLRFFFSVHFTKLHAKLSKYFCLPIFFFSPLTFFRYRVLDLHGSSSPHYLFSPQFFFRFCLGRLLLWPPKGFMCTIHGFFLTSGPTLLNIPTPPFLSPRTGKPPFFVPFQVLCCVSFPPGFWSLLFFNRVTFYLWSRSAWLLSLFPCAELTSWPYYSFF